MPCRHKGNKQALLSAASTIPHQWLHNNHPSAASLKKKRKKEKWSISQRRLFENHVHFHCFNRHKHSFFSPLCCHILFCQKFLSLFQSAGIKWCFITLDHLSDIEYLRKKWLSGAPALCEKQHPSQSALSDKYATVGPVNKGSTPLLLGWEMTSAPQVWLSENQAFLSSVPGTVCVCNCFEPSAQW